MNKKLKVILQISFSLALGGFFIWFFVRRLSPEEIDEIWNAFKRADYTWLIIAFFIGIASHWVRAIRSILLLEPINYKPRKVNAFFATIIGYLANLAVPRLGEVLRCSVLMQYEKIPISKSFGTVITERVIDMLIYALLFLFVLTTFSAELYEYAESTFLSSFLQKVSLLRLTGILSAAMLLMMIIYFTVLRKRILKYMPVQKAENFIKGIWTGLKSIAKLKRPVIFTLETVLIWILYYAGFYICFLSLPETATLSPGAGLAAMAFATIGGILVQGGIGLYPLFVAGTLALYGVSEPIGYALGWLAWSAQQIAVILAGTLSIFLLPHYNRKMKIQNENEQMLSRNDEA